MKINSSLTRFARFAFLCVAVSMVAGCASVTWADYAVIDSRKYVVDTSNIYWLDNHRVLFQGLTDQHFVRADGFDSVYNALYIWDIENGSITEHGHIEGSLCYADGFILYSRWNESAPGTLREWVAGEFGQQVKVGEGRSYPKGWDSETCRPRNDSDLPQWTSGKKVKRLRPEHGFLVLGPENEDRNTPVTYHPKGALQGITMPFRRREFNFVNIQYAPFKDAYFIVSHYFKADDRHPLGGYGLSPWPKDIPQPVWWLYPDGRVEELRLPSEARFGGSRILGLKPGVFFISPAYTVNMDGVFLVLNGEAKRILKGFIERFAVSPDGCQIAMELYPDRQGNRYGGSLKVINVCKRGG